MILWSYVFCVIMWISAKTEISLQKNKNIILHTWLQKKLSPKKVWSMNDEAEMLEGKWLCRYIISDSLLSLFTKNLCYGNPFLPRKCG